MQSRSPVTLTLMPTLAVGLCLLVGACKPSPAPAPEAVQAENERSGAEAASLPGGPGADHVYRLDYRPEMIGRVYDTDFGLMILDRFDRDGAGGRYAGRAPDGTDAGTFEGQLQPTEDVVSGTDRIEGHWYARSGSQPCDEERNGTRYWGRIQFNFPRDSQDFIGFWGHCDGTTLDRWNGTFLHRAPAIAAAVAAQMPQGEIAE